MRFIAQDPDIETIVRRIEEGDYDLQPDFQRGEVWTLQKKRRLVDSLLRGWHVPPVHLVARPDGRSDVLDGQQRLTAIRDFVRGLFTVDGSIEPHEDGIASLNGMRFAELPDSTTRAFRKVTLRVFELVDYSPDEPHELFFRLNQPTSLTEAEKRNAFIGTPRNQVRALVGWATEEGLLSEALGFTNARMAYDDMLARALLTIERKSLEDKITASGVTQRYRDDRPFDDDDVDNLRRSMRMVLPLFNETPPDSGTLRPNKATLHTWLCIGAQLSGLGEGDKAESAFRATITTLETARWNRNLDSGKIESQLTASFQDRSTSRVADVSSVILRDLIAWIFFSERYTSEATDVKTDIALAAMGSLKALEPGESIDAPLLSQATQTNWGELGWH